MQLRNKKSKKYVTMQLRNKKLNLLANSYFIKKINYYKKIKISFHLCKILESIKITQINYYYKKIKISFHVCIILESIKILIVNPN
jgi:hypothetical protein